jgi:cellobiose phosphorylase
MKPPVSLRNATFSKEAEQILALPIAHRVNSLGGYGPGGEVIYENHPVACPSTLVTTRGSAKSTFMSNGSVGFEVKLPNGMDVRVLKDSFDSTEKFEIGAASSNIWLSLAGVKQTVAASLINPANNQCCEPVSIRIVKLGDPGRAMWYCAEFAPEKGLSYTTAVKVSMVSSEQGPVLLREVFIKNTGKRALNGNVWTYYNLQGSQCFSYNKGTWYDSGIPVTPTELVVAATVPFSDIVQIKRISSVLGQGLKAVDATCDYTSFIGNSGALSAIPQCIKNGKLLPGAGRKLNRFSTPTVAANQFALKLPAGKSAQVQQSLLYVTNEKLQDVFRKQSACAHPGYPRVSKAFLEAAKAMVKGAPDAARIAHNARNSATELQRPAFELRLPKQGIISEYSKSVWTGVQELYENCRAHGAKLANGIELGTRDRGQDMWPKMKEDAGRVRADLVHAMSFMYVTVADGHRWNSPLTRAEKLHGMFPRQYPSRWDDRSKEIMNDNRPYSDSPVWLIDSLNMYLRETGDIGILLEKVKTVRLTKPDTPEQSGLVGFDKEFSIAEVMLEIFECFQRHIEDSPYGMTQIMYGDWCDPVDMFGTSVVGDSATRGVGRGVQVRLSAHIFNCLVATIDAFECNRVRQALSGLKLGDRVNSLKKVASELRKSIVRVAWEAGAKGKPGAFLNCIHELNRDGSRPNYAKGEIGYTIGSLLGRDFDGAPRRELLTQAHCLPMLLTRRDYLEAIPGTEALVKDIFATTDKVMYDDTLGLRLFAPPISNDPVSRQRVGRMGLIPAGCAENGEYHHAQVMMHRYRMRAPGQADTAWAQFKRIVSATRDESLGGPFEMPCTSYASDAADPHFGKGMYFGLSGSTDWIVEVFQAVPGVELNLHDDELPAVKVTPNLPKEVNETLTFRRIIHRAVKDGYQRIPLTVDIQRQGNGPHILQTVVTINGKRVESAEIHSLDGLKSLEFGITYVHGK